MPKLLVAPSILTADFARLGEQIREAEAAGVDWIHLDVMDGRFVPNLTFGPLVVEAIRKVTALPLDVHLMIVEPERYIADFARAGADWITVHHEATPHAHRAVQQIKELGKKAGLAINPGTPLEALLHLLPELDLALLMSVNPGFGGQKYIPASTERICRLSGLRQHLNPACLIQVDGGIKPENVAEVFRAGADVVVVGSALFNNRPVAENMEKLMGEVYAAGSR
jgi:ribulose-phosphate 3-epimerase